MISSHISQYIILLVFFASTTTTTEASAQHRFRVMEWNVENLFDTIPSSDRNDTEFTPEGKMKWNTPRYWSKLGKMSRVIAACGGDTPCALVALCEVENDSIMSHLVQRTMLRRLGYKYLITHSNDPRGVNVALLYQPFLFRPLLSESLRVPHLPGKELPTRDILHVTGLMTTGDTLDVYICHWPSRRGGIRTTGKYRMRAAERLKASIIQLKEERENLQVLVTGDLNSFYPERCIKHGLGCSVNYTNIHRDSLYILSHALSAYNGKINGTYLFQGEWNQLDHFIVNGGLLANKGNKLHCRPADCHIAFFPFLVKEQKKEGRLSISINRTFAGPFYIGGYSDHLPLTLDLYHD